MVRVAIKVYIVFCGNIWKRELAERGRYGERHSGNASGDEYERRKFPISCPDKHKHRE